MGSAPILCEMTVLPSGSGGTKGEHYTAETFSNK